MKQQSVFLQQLIAVIMISFFGLCAKADGNVTNSVHMVMKIASMGKAVSNELVRIAYDENVAIDMRKFAAMVLNEHDRSGTNSYMEIASFATNWNIVSEPPMTTNTILVMKRALELGISSLAQLQYFSADTNTPTYLRGQAETMLNYIRRP